MLCKAGKWPLAILERACWAAVHTAAAVPVHPPALANSAKPGLIPRVKLVSVYSDGARWTLGLCCYPSVGKQAVGDGLDELKAVHPVGPVAGRLPRLDKRMVCVLRGHGQEPKPHSLPPSLGPNGLAQ